jgi:hypothetical protein
MLKVNTTKLIAACAAFPWAISAFGHENHGLNGSHWHATDVWGFVALAALLAAAIWLGRGGK